MEGNADAFDILEIEQPKLYDAVLNMRNSIDELSTKLVEENLVSNELEASILGNMGAYLKRSYKIYEAPNEWLKELEGRPELRIRAQKFVYSELKKELGREPTVDEFATAIDEKIDQRLEVVAQKSSTKGGGALQIDQTSFLQRENIPKPIRELMGEYDSIEARYLDTIKTISSIYERNRLLHDLRITGQGTLFTKDKTTDNSVLIPYGNTKNNYGALGGMYTTPEMKDIIDNGLVDIGSYEGGMKWYMSAVSAAKFSKTVLSPTTHIKNSVGGQLFLIANGHVGSVSLGGKNVDILNATIRKELGRTLDLNDRANLDRWARLGLIGSDAYGTEAQILRQELGLDKSRFKILNKINDGLETATDLYQSEDAFSRIAFFEIERNRYAKTKFGQSMSVAELDIHVANNVRDIYQNYGAIPLFLQKQRMNPLVGSFVSFSAEVIRNSVNSIRLMGRELRLAAEYGDVRMGAIAGSRAVGMLSVTAGATVAANMIAQGVGLDPEQIEAMRSFLPEWDRDGNIFMFKTGYDNDLRVMNLDSINPYGLVRRLVHVGLREYANEGGLDNAILETVGELVSTFVDQDISFKAFIETVQGRSWDNPDYEIWTDSDTLGTKVMNSVGHMWSNAYEPGGITSGRRLLEGMEEKNNRTLGTEVAAFLGARTYKPDVMKSLSFAARDYVDERRGIRAGYNRARYSGVGNTRREYRS